MIDIQQEARRILDNAALALAHQHKLIDDDGTIWCWHCESNHALLPSLHCGKCLGAHYAKHHITDPQCMNRAQAQSDTVNPTRSVRYRDAG